MEGGRYILQYAKIADWDELEAELKVTGFKLHAATLKRIRERLPINNSTVTGIAEHLRKYDAETYSDVKGDYFELSTQESRTHGNRGTRARIRRNTLKSNDMQKWVDGMLRHGQYDQAFVISYTSESIQVYLKNLPLHVKSLVRNWVSERRDEEEFNNKIAEEARKKNVSITRRPWEKAHSIRGSSEMMKDIKNAPCLSLEQRFYEIPPCIKGIVLIDSKTDRRAAYFGFYKWIPDREGGSPYEANEWNAFELRDGDEEQSRMIDSLLSRFDQLWDSSKSFDEVEKEHSAFERELIGRKLWEVDRSLPYKIVIPGAVIERSSKPNASRDPDVKYRDALASNEIKKFLEGLGCEAHVVIMPIEEDGKKGKGLAVENWYGDNISNFTGHVVYVCSRTLSTDIIEYMQKDGFPFVFNRSGATHYIMDMNTGLKYLSPLDSDEKNPIDTQVDYCLLGRFERVGVENGAKNIIITGIHSLGTLGGAIHLTDVNKLNFINERVNKTPGENNDFVLMVQVVKKPLEEIQTGIFGDPAPLNALQVESVV